MYIKFTDINDFNTWHEQIMTELGIPDGLGTLVYTEPIIHSIDGSVVAVIDERVEPGERLTIEYADLFTEGYLEYPKVPYPF